MHGGCENLDNRVDHFSHREAEPVANKRGVLDSTLKTQYKKVNILISVVMMTPVETGSETKVPKPGEGYNWE